MSKNILLEFHNYAKGLVARHERGAQRFLGVLGSVADGLIPAIPLARNGFLQTVWDMHPDWHRALSAYHGDLVPLAVSAIYVAGAVAMGRGKFALCNGAWATGSAALAVNLYMHHEPMSAAAMLPSVFGGIIGASHKYLERTCGHSKNRFVRCTFGAPKRMAGISYFFTSIPATVTSVREKLLPLFVSSALWSINNYTLTIMPPADKAKGIQANRPVTPHLPDGTRNASLG